MSTRVRRDRRGRRIGRNPWRDHITAAWRCADHAWWLDRERVAMGYATEQAEYREQYPRPNLGDFMRALSPGWRQQMGGVRQVGWPAA